MRVSTQVRANDPETHSETLAVSRIGGDSRLRPAHFNCAAPSARAGGTQRRDRPVMASVALSRCCRLFLSDANGPRLLNQMSDSRVDHFGCFANIREPFPHLDGIMRREFCCNRLKTGHGFMPVIPALKFESNKFGASDVACFHGILKVIIGRSPPGGGFSRSARMSFLPPVGAVADVL
jgi:hypothetical protein